MRYFKNYFQDTDFTATTSKGEVPVLCPFHNDTNPTANVNTEKGMFYCYACAIGYDEPTFMSQTMDITHEDAIKLVAEYSGSGDMDDWNFIYKADYWADEELMQAVEDLGISTSTAVELNLGKAIVKNFTTLAIPIFFNKQLMDVRRYNILNKRGLPKMVGNTGAKIGWFFPYDTWDKESGITYIFEGEKDTILANELGINAICITGGAGALPNEYMYNSIKGQEFIICYDNDEAGRDGSLKLANFLYHKGATVNILDISQVVHNDKDDFYDYMTKYGGDPFTFATLTYDLYEPKVEDIEYTTIAHALENIQFKQEVRTQVMVTSDISDVFSTPSVVHAIQDGDMESTGEMHYGEERSWVLGKGNAHQMLNLIEVDAKTGMVFANLLNYLGIDKKEKGVTVDIKDNKFIYKAVVTDTASEGMPSMLDLYTFDKLQVGSSYDITYKIFAHPNKHQKLVGIAQDVIQIGDNSNFKPKQELLEYFKGQGSIKEQVLAQFNSAKHYVAPHMDYNIWLMTDLVFNSILDFDYGGVMRGALDVFLLGDTQVGKSETTSKLTELYEFGHFLSLKTSTTKGLIGGSNKVDGTWQSTIGAIPRQHKKLAILEEFSGAEHGFIKSMTDIRSSNMIRITRTSGELIVPCKLRMMTISNPLNDMNGNPRNLSSFPNGVIPIMELITSAEDVTRYDGFLLCPKPEGRFNPFANKLTGTPFPKEAYTHRIQFSATRAPENVLFDDGVEGYIWEQSEILNSKFESNVPIFGTTTSKKLARFAVAMASLLMSTDDFINIVVTQEIVDFTVAWLDEVYSSEYFRLDKVKEEHDSYSVFTDLEQEELQDLYLSNIPVLDHLAGVSKTTRQNLQALSGQNNDTFSVMFNTLSSLKVIRLDGYNIYPTEKFRRMYRVLDKKAQHDVSKYKEATTSVPTMGRR